MSLTSLQMGEKAVGLSLHVDCVLACSVASGSGFGLTADVEEKIVKSCLFSSVQVEICSFKPT